MGGGIVIDKVMLELRIDLVKDVHELFGLLHNIFACEIPQASSNGVPSVSHRERSGTTQN
jgi:hypothetical protein